jgi:hypothetical protein
MIRINLLKPKWSGNYLRFVARKIDELWWEDISVSIDSYRDYIKQTNGPMTQSWVPATCKLKSIPSPPKPKDMSDDEWKTLHDMINGR